MTKLEKMNQKVANKIFRQTLRENRKRAKEFAYYYELQETMLFHLTCIEKIINKEMPKDWKLKVSLTLLDPEDKMYCSSETHTIKGINGRIGFIANVILRELLDKTGLDQRNNEINQKKQQL